MSTPENSNIGGNEGWTKKKLPAFFTKLFRNFFLHQYVFLHKIGGEKARSTLKKFSHYVMHYTNICIIVQDFSWFAIFAA